MFPILLLLLLCTDVLDFGYCVISCVAPQARQNIWFWGFVDDSKLVLYGNESQDEGTRKKSQTSSLDCTYIFWKAERSVQKEKQKRKQISTFLSEETSGAISSNLQVCKRKRFHRFAAKQALRVRAMQPTYECVASCAASGPCLIQKKFFGFTKRPS